MSAWQRRQRYGSVWLVEGVLPKGAVATIADADDGTPEEVLAESAYDVVIHLGGRDPHLLSGRPFLVTVLFRDGVFRGLRPTPPFWSRYAGPQIGFVRVEEGRAA